MLVCCGYDAISMAQVTTTVLKSGEEIESDIVVVGVGARPNVELLKGQVDLLEDKPGGIKVQMSAQGHWQIWSMGELRNSRGRGLTTLLYSTFLLLGLYVPISLDVQTVTTCACLSGKRGGSC